MSEAPLERQRGVLIESTPSVSPVHDSDALFEELEKRGYTLERRHGLVASFEAAL